MKFNYKRMNHYDLLGVNAMVSEKELKVAYLKLAKKYHPDIYKGINKDHFKKVNEAYSTLKNPHKRADYDQHSKIRTNRTSKQPEEYGVPKRSQTVRDF